MAQIRQELFARKKVSNTNKSSSSRGGMELPKELFFDLKPLLHIHLNQGIGKSSKFHSFYSE